MVRIQHLVHKKEQKSYYQCHKNLINSVLTVWLFYANVVGKYVWFRRQNTDKLFSNILRPLVILKIGSRSPEQIYCSRDILVKLQPSLQEICAYTHLLERGWLFSPSISSSPHHAHPPPPWHWNCSECHQTLINSVPSRRDISLWVSQNPSFPSGARVQKTSQRRR